MPTEDWRDEPTPVTAAVPQIPLSQGERERVFGMFFWAANPTHTSPEQISLTGDWVAKNILTIATPQLAPLNVHTVRFHRLGAKQFTGLLSAWATSGLIHQIESWDGSFVPRLKRGKAGSSDSADLSNHSWGTAFDINARWNPLGAIPVQRGQRGCVRDLVQLAREFGFFWGGDFHSRLDGMHFEICRLIE
jgi:hypothetical protein